MTKSKANVRDDWWHTILFLPIAMVIGIPLPGFIQAMLFFPILLLYPIAMRKDAQWVTGTSSNWNPSANKYTILGVLVFVTFGLLSFIISPIYMYRRKKHV